MATLPVLLTIAGSDSGGGAGIQADLKTFQAFGAFGTSAITAVTCQNTQSVSALQEIEPHIVGGQIKQVLEDFPVRTVKTGMLLSADIIRIVRKIREEKARDLLLVVDPVMVAASGDRLLRTEAESELVAFLASASLITPNLPEAEIILGHPLETISDMKAAARELYEKSGAIVLLKGGHRKGGEEPETAIDIYYDGNTKQEEELRHPWLKTKNTHGTGCTLSAAIAACLGTQKVLDYFDAVTRARAYLQQAIANAPQLGSGLGPVNHLWNYRL